jgi:hypothetical protein
METKETKLVEVADETQQKCILKKPLLGSTPTTESKTYHQNGLVKSWNKLDNGLLVFTVSDVVLLLIKTTNGPNIMNQVSLTNNVGSRMEGGGLTVNVQLYQQDNALITTIRLPDLRIVCRPSSNYPYNSGLVDMPNYYDIITHAIIVWPDRFSSYYCG